MREYTLIVLSSNRAFPTQRSRWSFARNHAAVVARARAARRHEVNSPGAVAEKVLRFAQPGDIVVEHVASDASAAALPTILDIFEERGWKVGTVSEVLGLARYDATQPMLVPAQPTATPVPLP